MKVLVGIKRVIDPYVKIQVKADGTGIEMDRVKKSINPFDEIALEEAIRLREAGAVTEVVALSIDTDSSEDTLRQALALGADRAILVLTKTKLSPLNVAKVFKNFALKEEVRAVLMGKQSIDGDHNQTPQMLAGLLDWPQATFISNLNLTKDSGTATREIDGGLATIKFSLPAVVSVDLRLNTPRYASLPNIMKAKQKPLEVLELESLNLELASLQKFLGVKAPQKRAAGKKVASVAELIQCLQGEMLEIFDSSGT